MNEVANVGKNEVAPVGEVRLGFDEPIDRADLIIPTAKLFQGNATEADQYPDAKGGQVLNSLTKELLPSVFVPVFKWTEVVKFNGRPKDENYDPQFEAGALIWKCTDPTDARWKEGDWGQNGEKPTATRTMNFMTYFVGVPMPIILRFSKTSYKAGKTLLSLAQFSGGDMFSRKYNIGTKKETSADGDIYYVYTVTVAGVASAEEQAVARQWHNDLHGKALQIHEDAPKTEASEGWKE